MKRSLNFRKLLKRAQSMHMGMLMVTLALSLLGLTMQYSASGGDIRVFALPQAMRLGLLVRQLGQHARVDRLHPRMQREGQAELGPVDAAELAEQFGHRAGHHHQQQEGANEPARHLALDRRGRAG